MNFFKSIAKLFTSFFSLFFPPKSPKTTSKPIQPKPAPEAPKPKNEEKPTQPKVEPTPPPQPALPQVQDLDIKTIGTGSAPDYLITNGTHEVKFEGTRKGYYTLGRQKVTEYIKAHSANLESLNLSQSAINLIQSVSDNEGNLDAINTWDNSFLTVGMFQWSMGTKGNSGELPALFAKIKRQEPDLFEHYLGQFGLDISSKTTKVYGYFLLKDKRIDTVAEKEEFRTAGWGYRFWLACQDPKLQAIQIEHALSRLKTFYWKARTINNLYAMSDVVTSEYGVALILDNHVNRPGYVDNCLELAMEQTGLSDPTNWGTVEERKVIDAYIDIRATFGKSPMTDANHRARNTKKYLDQGLISDERQSFKYEPQIGTRSLDPIPAHTIPSGYSDSDYEFIREFDDDGDEINE